MRLSYPINPAVAVEGEALAGYESRPMLLPLVAQEQTAVFADDSEAGDVTVTVTDLDVGQARTLTVALGGAVLATSLDEIVAAWQADSFLSALATMTEDGTDTVTLNFRVRGENYSTAWTVPGAMTSPTVTTTVAPINERGLGVEFGRFVQQGAGDSEIAILDSGATVGSIVGLIRRTEGNHFHKLQESLTDVDATLRGKDYPVIDRGRIWVRVEEAVTPATTAFARISGSGAIGAFRSDADGGDAIDVSSICRFERSTLVGYGGVSLALLRVNIL